MRVITLTLLLLIFSSCKKATLPPNILFIVVDDLGHRDLSSTGSDFYETFNIDRIAEEGTRFTQGHSNSSVCSPSRASLLTGLYPTVHGITDWIGAKREKNGEKWDAKPNCYPVIMKSTFHSN